MTLVVVRLDRLARSVSHLLDVIEELTDKGAHLVPARGEVDGVRRHGGHADLLRNSPPRPPEDRLITLVAGIHLSNPELTLREIAGQLERLHERTPRGGTKWAPSSVKNLIDRANRVGLLAVT